MSSIKLFCIPYSGGMAGVYYKWKNLLLPEIKLQPIEAAGHGQRIRDPFYKDVSDAADDFSNRIIQELKENESYAIFGHSLGALYAFETYYALKKKGIHEPEHIFFSGRLAPDVELEPTEYYKLPEEEFMEVVKSYGGNTGEIMQNRELLNLFVPILRADFRVGETYEYVAHNEKIMCDMSIVNGTDDLSVKIRSIEQWGDHAGKNCDYNDIKGNHFYILENMEDTVRLINDKLKNKIK